MAKAIILLIFTSATGFLVLQLITHMQVKNFTKCADFGTRISAQEAYNKNPSKYASLDGYDQDGKVCESLPRK